MEISIEVPEKKETENTADVWACCLTSGHIAKGNEDSIQRDTCMHSS